MTQAELFAHRFGDDGQCWEDTDGWSFETILVAMHAREVK